MRGCGTLLVATVSDSTPLPVAGATVTVAARACAPWCERPRPILPGETSKSHGGSEFPKPAVRRLSQLKKNSSRSSFQKSLNHPFEEAER